MKITVSSDMDEPVALRWWRRTHWAASSLSGQEVFHLALMATMQAAVDESGDRPLHVQRWRPSRREDSMRAAGSGRTGLCMEEPVQFPARHGL
ncbi:hypothetical protein ABZ484_20785 [Streptomyces sp. NPDC006393]|uniref:hypothetical protein n=1 Tax=Streptomyces sp. NPDC006393 TaxID=3156763 RepID=UPI0033F8BBD8